MSNFLIVLCLFGLIALFCAGRAFLAIKAIRQDAQDDYNYKQDRGMIDGRLTEVGYKRAYKRFYGPRKYMFMAGAFAAAALLSLPILAAARFILTKIWESIGRPDIMQPDYLGFTFLLWVTLLIFWVLIFFTSTRLYYRGSPVSLRDEMIKEMD